MSSRQSAGGGRGSPCGGWRWVGYRCWRVDDTSGTGTDDGRPRENLLNAVDREVVARVLPRTTSRTLGCGVSSRAHRVHTPKPLIYADRSGLAENDTHRRGSVGDRGCDLPVDVVGDGAPSAEDEGKSTLARCVLRNAPAWALRLVGRVRSIGPLATAMNAPPLRASGKVVPVARPAVIWTAVSWADKEGVGHGGGGVVAVRADDRLVGGGTGRRCWPTHRRNEGTGLLLLCQIVQHPSRSVSPRQRDRRARWRARRRRECHGGSWFDLPRALRSRRGGYSGCGVVRGEGLAAVGRGDDGAFQRHVHGPVWSHGHGVRLCAELAPFTPGHS